MKWDIKHPCKNCPFRCDGNGVQLGSAASIAAALKKDDHTWFICHETLQRTKKKQSHCIGAAIVLWRERNPNLAMRLAMAFELLIVEQLETPTAPIFDSLSDFVNYHTD
jgi:hypothetical protein